MTQPSELMTVASFVSLAVLCVLGLRKLIIMDGLLELRAVILMVPLCLAVLYLFVLALPASDFDCVSFDGEPHAFTISN